MFGSDYFGKDYFGQDYFANELVNTRPEDFFNPRTGIFLDNFNRADGDPANGWVRSSNNVQIFNNEVLLHLATSTEQTLIQPNLFAGSAAQNKYAQVQMRYLNSSPLSATVIYTVLIISYTDINNWVGVECYTSAFAGRTKLDLISRVAGVDTILASSTPALIVGAENYNLSSVYNLLTRIVQRGSLIEVYFQLSGAGGTVAFNNTPFIVYNGPALNNGSVGILANTDSSNFPMIDNFQSDSIGQASGGRRRRHLGSGGCPDELQ